MEVLVIGSGMAGLTAAAALSGAGHSVVVMEQAKNVGGVTAAFCQDGYRWDLGQLMIEGLGKDEPSGRVLAELGVLDKIRVKPDDRGYVFPDFELRKPAAYAGFRWRMELLAKQFPEDAAGLDRYWRDYVRFTRVMTLAQRSDQAQGLPRIAEQARLYLALLRLIGKRDWSAERLMKYYFKSEKLRAVFISILADFFTPPSQFPGLGVYLLNQEVSFDARMPKTLAKDAEQVYQYDVIGGISTVVDALAQKINENGGKLFTERPVVKILVEDGRIKGAIDGWGNQVKADVIVASGGVQDIFLTLVGEANLPEGYGEKIRKAPLMDSVFMVHLGLDFDPRLYVHGPVTYYYGSYDVEGGINTAKKGRYHEGRDGFVVHVPSLHSPEMAPVGRHAMTLYTICPDRLQAESWNEKKEGYADLLVAYAEKHIPGLSSHICTRAIITPEDFRARTHTRHHAFGGIAPVLGAWKMPHKTPVKGLWFIGAQSESGGGVGAVMTSSYKVAKQILTK